MEELLELKNLIYAGDTTNALLLIEEIEEMSKEDKINKMDSYAIILLIHLIKQNVEARTTRSWQVSIDLAVNKIQKINRRRKAGGNYLDQAEIEQLLSEAYAIAIKQASLEAFEGIYDSKTLTTMVNQEVILSQALTLILSA
jgi:hypothetical protein